MESKVFTTVLSAGIILAIAGSCQQPCKAKTKWAVHDMNRPQPTVITPAEQVGQPPSDAIVLFDGKDLSKWEGSEGKPAQWKVENGYMEVVDKTGDIHTRQGFGDCQIHIEWTTPEVVKGESQGRGNSGVFLMDNYELQVLDSFNNKTYPDGQAGSIYGQNPPFVNVCRPPGQWQTYDIVFHRPHFDKSGKVTCPARITVFQNGVLIQDNFKLTGPTAHGRELKYKPHLEKLPLRLQEHECSPRYRNIWIRPLD
jgi:hypothetical protein